MKKDAKNLKLQYFLRKYMTYIVVVLILAFLIFMKLYVFWFLKQIEWRMPTLWMHECLEGKSIQIY